MTARRFTPWHTPTAWALTSCGVALAAVGLWLTWIARGVVLPSGYDAFVPAVFVLTFLGTLVLVVAGGILAARRPSNPVGWLMLVAGVGWEATNVAGVVRVVAFQQGTTAPWAGAIWDATWMLSIPLVFVVFLVFPDGRLPSRRWRPVLALVVTGMALLFVSIATRPGPLFNTPVDNPLGVGSLAGVVGPLEFVGNLALALGLLGSLAAPVARYRRAATVERYQLKWFLTAAAVVGAVWLVAEAIGSQVSNETIGLMRVTSLGAVPVATAIAVLRYRLYDIDRLISRTLGYALVTLVLAAIYIGMVLGLGGTIRAFTGQDSALVVAASTLAVAAAFRPVTVRIRRAVERRFNRPRYDAQQAIERFGATLRTELDIDGVAVDMVAITDQVLRPSHVGVWLRSGA